MAKQYDILLRLLMLGDSGVGKTSMLRRFTESDFDSSHFSTIGVDFKMKTLEIDGVKVRVQIWDTAGQERYQSITKQYYSRAQGIVFVYDITNDSSFQHISKWASDVDELAPHKIQRILVGNKSDETLNRQVPFEQGVKLAESYGMDFFETSAPSNSNIYESFTCVTELVLRAHNSDIDNPLGSLDDNLDNVALGEESASPDTGSSTQRTCAC